MLSVVCAFLSIPLSLSGTKSPAFAATNDLIQLISFAGGPVQYAKLDEVKLTRLMLGDTTGGEQMSEVRRQKSAAG